MIKIYGTRMSRANRCMWVLEELGLAYEQVPVGGHDFSNREPDFLALNPAGKVPVLDADGFVLRESLAIAFYLVDNAETPLWPDDRHTRALIYQWASWAMTEVEGPLSTLFTERRRLAGGAPDPDFVASRTAVARDAIELLEAHLATNAYVASKDFTLGDLLACSVMALAPQFVDLSPYPAIKEWTARCTARSAWARAEARN